jgi:WD40 repeat protein
VSDIAFSPDGRELATAGRDKNVRIWDISTGYPQPKQLVLSHSEWVRDVAFLPRQNRLVTVANDTAYLWTLDDPQKPLCSFIQGSPIYGAFAVSRDGNLLATAGNGSRKARLIKVWDLTRLSSKPEPVTSIDVAGAWIMGLAFSPDGSSLATACVQQGEADRASTTVVWNIKTGKEILRVPINVASDAVAFTPDGQSLVTANRDSWVRVWQPAMDTLERLIAKNSEPIAPGSAATSNGPAAIRWSERILAGHSDRVRNIALSPDGRRIASASGDNTAKIWDTATGENLLTLIGHEGFVEAVKFSPDGHHVATSSRDKTVKFWNIEGHTTAVMSIAFSPDGKTLATGSVDRTAKIWDLSRGAPRLRHTLRGHTDQVYRLAFNPAGTLLATAGFDNHVTLWNVDSGAAVVTLKNHADQLRGVGFSADGKHLASAGADGAIWLYDLESQDMHKSARPMHHNSEKPTTQASSLVFHPQRGQWATGGWDGKLQLWDVAGKNTGTIDLADDESERSKRITDIAFSPDGKVIAALERRFVYLWPVEAFERPHAKPIATLTMEDVGYCGAIAYSRDGGQLAIACNDASIRIYDTTRNTLAKTITVHKNAVTDVAFSADGTKLATASLDKTFQVSPLRFAELYKEAKRLRATTSGEKR